MFGARNHVARSLRESESVIENDPAIPMRICLGRKFNIPARVTSRKVGLLREPRLLGIS